MKLAILSNVTVELAAAGLRKEYELYIPEGFDTWQIEAANPASGLYRSAPDAVFVILHAERYHPAFSSRDSLKELLGSWLGSVRTLAGRLGKTPLFVSSLDLCPGAGLPLADERVSGTPEAIESLWIEELRSVDGVCVLPLKQTVCEMGRQRFYSPKMWYLGSSPFSLEGAAALAGLIRQSCFACFGSRKKCLAVDLDNTLWGGVIGEEGAGNVELSYHKEGARFLDAQRCLLNMQRGGVMLAVISKNNPEDVMPVFDRPEMLLKPEHFVALKINWEPKPQNMRALASELNIGLDSFVFLDDNPAEREEMRAACPEVTVLEFPKDTALLARTVEEAYVRYFRPVSSTDEDALRTEQYRQSAKRAEMKSAFADPDDYLKNLEMRAEIHIMREGELPRAAQLAGKTNQFNTTTVRYTENELAAINDSGAGVVITAHMRDRFGDEGLTSVMVLRFGQGEATVEDFIMSCRVMGRRFEFVIFDTVMAWLKKERPDIRTVRGRYIATRKNKPVEKLYDALGFEPVSEIDGGEDGTARKDYLLRVNAYEPRENTYREIRAFEGH